VTKTHGFEVDGVAHETVGVGVKAGTNATKGGTVRVDEAQGRFLTDDLSAYCPSAYCPSAYCPSAYCRSKCGHGKGPDETKQQTGVPLGQRQGVDGWPRLLTTSRHRCEQSLKVKPSVPCS